MLGAGMVSTFMDNATTLGQQCQPILNILLRNRGALKVNMRQILFDNQGKWWDNCVQAKATITLPAKGGLPLRETVWTLQELANEAQIWTDAHKPAPSVKFHCRGSEHTVLLLGVPQMSACRKPA